MNDSYPFVGIVREREGGSFVSIQRLEQMSASKDLVNAVVNGPLELAIKLMTLFNSDLIVESNVSGIYED